MSDNVEDLWPTDLVPERIRTPISVLKEQAGNLSKHTKYIVQGVVKSTRVEGEWGGEQMRHEFMLSVPALNGYQYALFSANHHPVHVYPVTLEWETTSKCTDEEGLTKTLRTIFAHSTTRTVLTALVSQASDSK